MSARQYILLCDESIQKGRFYSNFYGGLIVSARHYQQISHRLNEYKRKLGFGAELKWGKVSPDYLENYQQFVKLFFHEVREERVRVRIMFRQNAHAPTNLTANQLDTTYYRLYYQFIKHSFGLPFIDPSPHGTRLRLYFDEFPDTSEGVAQFRGYLLALQHNYQMEHLGLKIANEDIAEVRSHNHILLQCVDLILGSMQFRLNDKHKEKPPGARFRGKRTRAKELLYKTILEEIRTLRPNFNIGVSTKCTPAQRWSASYLHWCFQPYAAQYQAELTKNGNKNR